MTKRIYLNAFQINSPGHLAHGLWAHPHSQANRFQDLNYWTELAELLEQGGMDGLFIADVNGVYDSYQNNQNGAIRHGVQFPVHNPLLLVSAMAHVTKNLAFGITCSLTYEHPYSLARSFSTLDHLTKGRVAWNIVTSYLDSTARNYGLEQQISHDERYDIADEYMEVCYKLWEGSWEDDALLVDRSSRVYTDPSKVHEIGHEGKYFKVPGVHMCEPSPQRTPVLFQAGTSPKGKQFAAKHAECVFLTGPTVELVKADVDDLRRKAAAFGRNPTELLIFNTFTPIIGRTNAEAQNKYLEVKQFISYEATLVFLSGLLNLDLSQYDPDESLQDIETNGVRSLLKMFSIIDPHKKWTLREIVDFCGIGGSGPVEVGTPAQIADSLEYWINESGIDGFNIAYSHPDTFSDFVTLVIPELRRRGLYKQEYGEGAFREKLFGQGRARLDSSHPGAGYRFTTAKKEISL